MTRVLSGFCLLMFSFVFPIPLNGQDDNAQLDSTIERNNRFYLNALKNHQTDDIFTSLSTMFSIYLAKGDYTKSVGYGEQLYNIAILSKNPEWIIRTFIHLGELYAAMNDYPHAIDYYRRAMGIGNADKYHLEEDRLELHMAEAFAGSHNYDSADVYFQRYAQSASMDSNFYRISTGEYYLLKGQFDKALKIFESLQKGSGMSLTSRLKIDLAKTCLAVNQIITSLPYGREGIQLALKADANQYLRDGYQTLSVAFDRLGQTDSSNYYFRKYSIARDIVLNAQHLGKIAALTYEQQISRMVRENDIRELNLEKQTWMKNALFISILLLLLIAFTYSRYLTAKRKAEIRQRRIVENELQIQKLQSEKSTAELQQQKTELEMKALRAQMNPHFIFNCLNAINRFIIGNEARKAADYLTKFARLIRLVLEKSSASSITLKEELQALILYMDLESLRFENSFRYDLDTGNIDIENVLIPSLIFQPFVENAIWHGFRSDDKKEKQILVRLRLNDDQLLAEISDNGIGIRQSQILNTSHPDHVKSFGIAFTTERLQLAGVRGAHEVVNIQEITDEEGQVSGTTVSLKIPITLL